ncbi:MAG: GNAT family N-acetyltransferase [Treponema sp.]|nr:GNAT family N-acetyltransferase [Treponema sp.]
MEITFRAARTDDLDEVFMMVSAAIHAMAENGIFQWDSAYPAKDDFRSDILKNELHAGTIGGNIAVVYALNRECDEQYANGAWQYAGEDYLVLHRLCVSPDFQNMGVASRTLQHIEQESARKGIKAIRLDTFVENPFAVRLYEKNGYRTVGTARWSKGEFILLEKLLVA